LENRLQKGSRAMIFDSKIQTQMQTLPVNLTKYQLETMPVTDEQFEAFMRADNHDIPIETVEFFLPEFAD
jgi:hypothetical protein